MTMKEVLTQVLSCFDNFGMLLGEERLSDAWGVWGDVSLEDKANQHNRRKSLTINQEVGYDPTHTS